MNRFPSVRLIISLISIISFSPAAFSADIEAGKNKAAFCLGCHGEKGNSSSPQYPSLAGQRAVYLENQIKAFQSGTRKSPVMQGMVASLSTEDIKNVSAYFASQKIRSAGTNAIVPEGTENKVAMCKGCHGGSLEGQSGFPRLAGQQPEYIKKQLLNFKNNSRKGGPMNSISASIAEEDLNDIASYLGSL